MADLRTPAARDTIAFLEKRIQEWAGELTSDNTSAFPYVKGNLNAYRAMLGIMRDSLAEVESQASDLPRQSIWAQVEGVRAAITERDAEMVRAVLAKERAA